LIIRNKTLETQPCPALETFQHYGKGDDAIVKVNRMFLYFAFAVFGMIASLARTDYMKFDIVIHGGSFSAPAAALAAARTNPDSRILLIEPTDWQGGQATAQGVSAIDNAWHNPGATLMRTEPEKYYPADYLDFLNRLKNKPAEAPGEGMAPNGAAWVSREAFDPRTGAWLLDQMVSEYPNITLMKLTVVKDVKTSDVVDQFGAGKIITELTLIQRLPINGYKPFDNFLSKEVLDWYEPADSAEYQKIIHKVEPLNPAKGLVVIDASEFGDVMVLSDAVYTVGRELTTEKIADDGTLPALDEDGSQAYVFPFCMLATNEFLPENEIMNWFDNYDVYFQQQSNSYFSFGSHNWISIWTYRRLKCAGSPINSSSVYIGDVSMQNWYPGNDYPYKTMYKDIAAAAAEKSDWHGGIFTDSLAEAELHAICWYFYMKANKSVSWNTVYPYGNHAMNMMGTGKGLSRLPYIRCGRRIVGLFNFRITDRYFVPAAVMPPTSFRYYDSVGIGNYAADIHPSKISSGITPSVPTPAPFYIPYRSLGSVNVRNLLACGKQMAQSFVANSAYRLHPIEWASGSAAGVAAGLMARDGKTNYALLEIPALRELQQKVNANSPISWAAYDGSPIPSDNGELIVNDFKTIIAGTPFQVEIYHLNAAYVDVYLNGQFIGRTNYKANGRFVLDMTNAPSGSVNFMAMCCDADGKVLDILGAITAVEEILIIDNDDPACHLEGSWDTRTQAQPGKYGNSYSLSWGTNAASKATWEFLITKSGLYEIATWYPSAFNRAEDAPFTVHHARGVTTVPINQRLNGGMWNKIGDFFFDRNTAGKVVLTNAIANTADLVVADAIRIKWISPQTGVDSWVLYGR